MERLLSLLDLAPAPVAPTTPSTRSLASGSVTEPLIGAGHTPALQALVGHTFSDPALLQTALLHPSAAGAATNAAATLAFNRLEFLGDRALGLVIGEELCRRHPDDAVGALSRRLGALVSKEAFLCTGLACHKPLEAAST